MRWMRHLLGLATLVATIAGGTYLWSLLDDDGSTSEYGLTLLFEDAEGLREGAGVHYRGVRVGEVRSIRLDSTGESVQVRCSLDRDAEATVRASSRFWIVRPRFRSLAEGVSGLDTLVKDSYIVYRTPPGDAPRLPAGSRLPGLDGPLDGAGLGFDLGDRPGDLRFTVFFGDNRGLRPGARVLYRGEVVGRVGDVQLTEDGNAVRVEARVVKEFRHTVREGARFWAARPSVSVDWTSGLEVHDIDHLLTGTTLEYTTPEDATAPPASDGARFIGLLERPEIDWESPDTNTVRVAPPDLPADHPLLPALATVHYRFVERDFWSPNDEYRFDSIGVTILTANGEPAVILPRTSVEGAWLVTESMSDPDIGSESWRVSLADASVHDAGRVWVAGDDVDLALLRLDARAHPTVAAAAESDLVAFPTLAELESTAIEAVAYDEKGALLRKPGTIDSNGRIRGPAAEIRRGLLLCKERWVGVITKRTGEPTAVLFSALPSALRSATQ